MESQAHVTRPAALVPAGKQGRVYSMNRDVSRDTANRDSGFLHVLGLQALGPFNQAELNGLPFIESAITVTLD